LSELDAPRDEKGKHPSRQKLWVPLIVAFGFILGELVSYFSTEPEFGCRGFDYGPGAFNCGPGGFDQFPHFENDPLIQFHIVLTTMAIVLLMSLVVVYARVYGETKANFALGLVVVLFALLLEALLSYPLVVGFMGTLTLGPGLSSQFADVFTVCAYAIFLYLSLE